MSQVHFCLITYSATVLTSSGSTPGLSNISHAAESLNTENTKSNTG